MPYLAGQKVYAEDLNLVPVEGEQTINTSTTSTSYVFGSAALSASFTAPPSGNVKIQGYGAQSNSSATAHSYLSWQVREGTSQTGTLAYDPLDRVAYRTSGTTIIQAGSGRNHLVTGLVPGMTYTVWRRIRVSAGTGNWFTTAIIVEPTL